MKKSNNFAGKQLNNAGMKNMNMTFIEIIKKRLDRKIQQLTEIELKPEGLATAVDKRKFIEIKATIQELETVVDLAESMLEEEK